MKTAQHLSTIALLLFIAFVLVGCGSSYSSVSGSVGYGMYHGYDYPYYRYGTYHDRYNYRDVDRNQVQQRREQRIETRPQRQQNIQSARSRASSMGRPARAGGRGGRR